MSDTRLDIPSAYIDPAFVACVAQCLDEPGLVAQFDRLYGATLSGRASPIARMVDQATGKADEDLRAFFKFVHRSVYMTLPAVAIQELRHKAAACLDISVSAPRANESDQ